jgi:alginate O-acetyltransferase complex protein AlgI
VLFNSAAFLWLFLPVVLVVHSPLVKKSVPAANAFLLVASLVFYVWGSGHLVVLLLVSVVIDHVAATAAYRGHIQGNRRMTRFGVGLSVVANVGLLGWFKYAGFLAQSLESINGALGIETWGVPNVVLPIGISFFTFQSMSYTFDVAAGRLRPFRSPLRLLLYVSLFPQLIAGPIVRARDIEHELTHRVVDSAALGEGFSRFAQGLSKKVLVADSVAPLVDASFAAQPTTASSWIATIGYAVQIYFDFSGYSDMAIGLGQMLGFSFPENFRRPYSAWTVTDFWRRWHITLSSWFRDYVYIPAGGNRHGTRSTIRNLVLVFAITGLWHGAAWTFVLWGLWHGAALLIEKAANVEADDRAVHLRLWTLLVVLGGWILFRAPSLGVAGGILRAAVVPTPGIPALVSDALTPLSIVTLVAGILLAVFPERINPRSRLLISSRRGGTARLALYGLALPLVAIRVAADTFTPFLYFQF